MTEQDAAILAFEKRWWTAAGSKEAEIGAVFGVSAVRYYQLLARLLDDKDAWAAEPVLVKRLRRIRDSRRQGRVGWKELA